MRQLTTLLLLGVATALTGCESIPTADAESKIYQEDLTTESGEPAYITLQHCLIGFRGTGTKAIRTQSEAQQLAMELLEKAQGGEDFSRMVRKYTDDSWPGTYRIANAGFENDMEQRDPIYARDGLVPAFGDTGFPLEVGEYGLAEFDEKKSPFGWHLIKRIK